MPPEEEGDEGIGREWRLRPAQSGMALLADLSSAKTGSAPILPGLTAEEINKP